MPCARSSATARAGVGGGVALVEPGEHRVVDRLERRHHEQAPGVGELGPQVGVAQHVLDLDRAVEGDVGEALVHRPHDAQRVLRRVEEVGVAERDVLRARPRPAARCRRAPRPRRRRGPGRRRRPAPGSAGSGARTRATPRPRRRGAARRRSSSRAYAVERRQQVARARAVGARPDVDRASAKSVALVGVEPEARARGGRSACGARSRDRGRGGWRCASAPRTRPRRPTSTSVGSHGSTDRSIARTSWPRARRWAAAAPRLQRLVAELVGGDQEDAHRSRLRASMRDRRARRARRAARLRPRRASRPARTGSRGSGRPRGAARPCGRGAR